ncbi:MAG: CDP-glycerol glycerophosphotransferase family protein [Eubacterium sp.]|nr:CDP-glycerol glycerophosphotransferase family protein [Eubacterium sp.]
MGASMTNAVMKIERFEVGKFIIDIAVSFAPEKEVPSPRIGIIFNCSRGNRRLPMKVQFKDGKIFAEGKYDSSLIFYGFTPREIEVSFIFSDATDNGKEYQTGLKVNGIKKHPLHRFFILTPLERIKALAGVMLNIVALPCRMLPVHKNRISFFSNRTDAPTGNMKAVYNTLKDIENADIHLVCKKGGPKGELKVLLKFLYLYMTSKVVFVDDYYHLISYVKKKDKTKLIQLWHGCGAFKTFGFSRFHKSSVLEIYSANHRQYDYAIVSSPDICDFYAEAYGISSEKALALGSPRCDILSNEEYRNKKREEFFSEFPALKGKKLLLFAPTFRGKGNGDCYYPYEKFNADKVLETLGDEWGLVIKLHPYLNKKIKYSDKNKSRIADCANWDINDVLFSVDFLVTDYSSVIFEASLLEIPMAFLAFDLDEYIEKRDFYYDFRSFVPGPIVETDVQAAELAKSGNTDIETIKEFAKKSFGNTAGNACKNVKELTEKLLEE